MIDKRIEEAKEEIYEDRFLLNGEEVVFDNDTKEEMFYKEDIKQAIGLGAKWAIKELLKGLFHPASEVPRNDNGKVLAFSKDRKVGCIELEVYNNIAPSDSCDVCQDDFYLGDISYVHDLQHLLFGLGLNSEMEV